MKRSIGLMVFSMLLIAQVAAAYEYPLQFTPNPGYRGLVVAGYYFQGANVVGNCSYYTVSGGSGAGKGGGGGRSHIMNYAQTCTWDRHGNLLSIKQGAPPVPAPQYTKGSLIVYALDTNGDYTGTDIQLSQRGFVSSVGSHYTWLTSSSHTLLQQIAYTFTVVLKSDGDVPVDISSVQVSALQGAATLNKTDCNGEIAVGAKCSITLSYDPTQLTSATGLATDTLRIDLTSDAGEPHDFVQSLTIISPQNLN